MGKVYRFLGLTVGLVIHGVDPVGKKAAYNADITYGTNNEFGFDYLRDNMAISVSYTHLSIMFCIRSVPNRRMMSSSMDR